MDLLDDATKVEKRLVAKATAARIPITASFELTPCCNLQCDMCFISMKQADMKAHGGLKDLDFWLRLAGELKEMGTLFILLTGGEPLLYPHFKELYRELRRMGFILTLNTNGTCIDEETVRLFHENRPRRVNVTLYGASRETYGRLCHHASGFDRCMNGLSLLKEYDIDTKLNVSIVKENLDDFEKILAIGDRFGIPSVVNSYMFPCSRAIRHSFGIGKSRLEAADGGRIDALAMRHKKGAGFYDTVPALLDELERMEPDSSPVGLSCRAGSSSAWITWQGVMTPCVMMEYPAVHLDRMPVKDAWTEIGKMCRLLPPHDECRGCRLRGLCQVCYASAMLEKQHYGNVDYLCRFTEGELKTLKKLTDEKE